MVAVFPKETFHEQELGHIGDCVVNVAKCNFAEYSIALHISGYMNDGRSIGEDQSYTG